MSKKQKVKAVKKLVAEVKFQQSLLHELKGIRKQNIQRAKAGEQDKSHKNAARVLKQIDNL